MKTTAERIKEGLKLRELKQADLVERTGISKGALSSYMSGRYIPKQNNIYLIAKALNVSESWLMGFDVPMERTNNILPSVSETVKPPQIIGYYNSLNSTGQKEATKRVKELTYLPEYTSKVNQNEPEHLMPNAAHADDYDSAPDELKQLEENIMDDDDF